MTFEALISDLTQPLAGQYPRPWMTGSRNPESANVFIVGANQAKHFPVSAVSHVRHMDALINRNGESCRGVYDELHPKPSLTRPNIDDFVIRLGAAGVTNILETNVVCYSTGMSECLRRMEHQPGATHGSRIFRSLVTTIRPRIVVLHGSGTCERFEKEFQLKIARPPASEQDGMTLPPFDESLSWGKYAASTC